MSIPEAENATPDLSLRLGVDGLVHEANAGFLIRSGLTEEDLGKASFFSVTHSWDVPVVLESLHAMNQGTSSSAWESRLMHEKLGPRTVLWLASVVDDGSSGYRVWGTDVTAERRHKSDGGVGATHLQMALAAANAAAWDGELGADTVRIEDIGLNMLGLETSDQREILWSRLLERVHPDDRSRFSTALSDMFSTGRLDTRCRLDTGSGFGEHVAFRGRVLNRPDRPSRAVGILWNVTDQVAVENQLRHLALNDHLTGLPNRRSLELAAEKEWSRAERADRDLAVLMIDVDNFKSLNDTAGHETGDAALVSVGRILQSCLKRPTDLIGRYGGEEFLAVLPDVDRDGAGVVGEAMVAACRSGNTDPQITVSVGGAVRSPVDSSLWDLARRADLACYRAKAAGKDRYLAAPDPN